MSHFTPCELCDAVVDPDGVTEPRLVITYDDGVIASPSEPRTAIWPDDFPLDAWGARPSLGCIGAAPGARLLKNHQWNRHCRVLAMAPADAVGCEWCDDRGCALCSLRPTDVVQVRSGVL